MTQRIWDALIIGAGAAGLSAAQALGRSLRATLVIDAGEPRNRFAAHMHNVLGHDGRSPAEIVSLGRAEAEAYGVEFRSGSVVAVRESDNGLARFVIELADGETIATRALIVATGVRDELPDIPGIAENWGGSVLHCPYCHGWEVRGRRLGVITTSPAGMHQARLVRQWSEDVTVFSAGLGELDENTVRAFEARGVRLVAEPVVEVVGDRGAIRLVRTADGAEHEIDAVFTASTPVARDAFLDGLELARAPREHGGALVVDAMQRTSHPRIWAAGNVVVPFATVPLVAGAGAFTGSAVNAVLVDEDFDLALGS
ncbi:NAD(P)/FAD-dependent oxidoreductase [Microbacterium sp. ZW T5_56]|uniref:NAD(P)/FAD-dependent oxidoreductase n=1 Tax=Microbacterium sp. ZW T5_56 TaxID=3378081 RepID=UPI0038552C08